MSSPIQLGDIIAVLREIHNVYEAWKTIPEKLRKALKKFEEAEEEITTLNKILGTSRRREHRSYPGTDDLLADLNKARDYFQRYQPLTEDGQVRMILKAKTFFAVRMNEADVDVHVKTIDDHRDRIDKWRHTVLIQSALDNTELLLHIGTISFQQFNASRTTSSVRVQEQIIRDDASTLSSDQRSILTKASKSLRIAQRLESNPTSSSRLALSPIIEPSSASVGSLDGNEDVRHQIATYVEQKGLYTQDDWPADPIRDLEYIGRLPAKYLRAQQRLNGPTQNTLTPSKSAIVPPANTIPNPLPLRNSLQPESGTPSHVPTVPSDGLTNRRLVPNNRNPPSPQIQTTAGVDTDTNSLSPSWKAIINNFQDRTDVINSIETDKSLLPSPAVEFLDNISDASSSTTDESDLSDDFFTLTEPVIVAAPWKSAGVKCHLKVVKTAESPHIQCQSVKTYPSDLMPALGGSPYVAPSQLFSAKNETKQTIVPRNSMPLLFKHLIPGGLKTFPRILHTSAEGAPTPNHTHPYQITFYNHQYLQVEGYEKLPKGVKGLTYRFQNKADRDRMREEIFGKKLLASVGVANIQFEIKDTPKPCGTQAMSLWLNQSPTGDEEATSQKSLTVTIQCNSRGRPTDPDCAVELTVIKADNLENVRNKLKKELILQVQPLFATTLDEEVAAGVASGAILSSNASAVTTATGGSSSSERSQNKAELSPILRATTSIFRRRRASSVISLTDSRPTSPFSVYVKFTESSDEYIEAKKRFIDGLKTYLGGE